MISKKQWKENNNDSDLCYNDFVLSIKRIDNWSIYYGKEMNKVVMGELIDKAAVVSEIEGYISNYKDIVAKTDRNDSTWVDSVSMIDAKIDVLRHLLSFLNTIEVKEVDLDESARHYLLHEHISPLNEVLHQADLKVEMQYHKDIEDAYKAGFELRIKAQKGE